MADFLKDPLNNQGIDIQPLWLRNCLKILFCVTGASFVVSWILHAAHILSSEALVIGCVFIAILAFIVGAVLTFIAWGPPRREN